MSTRPGSAPSGFVDETTGAAYDPADYPLNGGGLFFVGVETDGDVYGYALNSDGSFVRVATIASGFAVVAELEYDPASGALLVICDDEREGQVTRFEVADSGAFEPVVTFARPARMANIAHEGVALARSASTVLALRSGPTTATPTASRSARAHSRARRPADPGAGGTGGTGTGGAGAGGGSRAELAATERMPRRRPRSPSRCSWRA